MSIDPSRQPYGAPELQAFQPRALGVSFLFSTVIVQALAMYMSWWPPSDVTVVPHRPPRAPGEWVLMPLPPLTPKWPVPAPIRGGLVPGIGTPVPVPDPMIDSSAPSDPGAWWTGEPGVISGDPEGMVGPGFSPPANVEPPPFVPHQAEPSVAVRVDPVYPPVAVRAGLEGNVFVKVWVDTEGTVRKAVIVKSDGEVFDEAALGAVRRWVFTPAMMQDRPVSVWVTIPVRFRLKVQ